MKGMLIPTNGNPVEIDIKVDEEGSTLHDLQRLVGGNIEPFDVIFGEGRENCTPFSAATSWPSGSTSRPERIATSQPMRCPA